MSRQFNGDSTTQLVPQLTTMSTADTHIHNCLTALCLGTMCVCVLHVTVVTCICTPGHAVGDCVCVLSRTTRVSRYQQGKTNLDFTEATDRERQRHQLVHMQVCTSLQTTTPISFLAAVCPSCCPTNSVKATKAKAPKANNRRLQQTSYKTSNS